MKENENKNQSVILTIGGTHFVLPIKSSFRRANDSTHNIVLEDNSKIEVSTQNIVLFADDSNLIKAILENQCEKFYMPETNENGKIIMKKINSEQPYKPLRRKLDE